MIRKIGVIFVLFCLLSSLYAFDFSSDVVVRHQQTGIQQGRMFVSGEKMRMEATDMIIITRTDKKIAWMLMPSQKIYIEQPINPNMIVTDKFPDETERRLIGQEIINERETDKYLVSVKNSSGIEKIYQWICKTTGIPLKTAAIDDSWSMEFKDLKTGKQEASLFELPQGYNKISMQMPQIPR